MSRIGKKPIPIPDGVKVSIEGLDVTVTGPLGELSRTIHQSVSVKKEDNSLIVERQSDRQLHRSLHGLTRTLIANMVEGTHQGFNKVLDIVGVGYKAELKGDKLQLALGFSHPILICPPPGIKFETPKPTQIIVSGPDKELVGEMAAKIRGYRPPEPYKGKGVKYRGEHIRRKAGKATV